MLKKVPRDIASWCCLYLATKPSHVGVEVNRLPCPLHRPTAYNCQTRGHGLLPGTVLSHRYSGRWCLFEGCEVPRDWIPALLNLTWGKLFLPGDTYPMTEPSWRIGV
jgi:hypothetical protein